MNHFWRTWTSECRSRFIHTARKTTSVCHIRVKKESGLGHVWLVSKQKANVWLLFASGCPEMPAPRWAFSPLTTPFTSTTCRRGCPSRRCWWCRTSMVSFLLRSGLNWRPRDRSFLLLIYNHRVILLTSDMTAESLNKECNRNNSKN